MPRDQADERRNRSGHPGTHNAEACDLLHRCNSWMLRVPIIRVQFSVRPPNMRDATLFVHSGLWRRCCSRLGVAPLQLQGRL